jgi:hypothetical protein
MKILGFAFSLLITLMAIVFFFIFTTMVCNMQANASEFHVVELNQLALDYKNYGMLNDKARNMLIYPEHPKESINIILNMDILKCGYWNSTIESMTTGSQYRAIGLETRLGFRPLQSLELGIYHHSQHVIDRPHAYMDKFASEDAVELKLYLFNKNSHNSIF